MRTAFLSCLLFALAACEAPPSTPNDNQAAVGTIRIERAWAAPTPAGVEVSAGYLTIANAGAADDRLLSATSPRAERVEIHEMTMDGAVMRMRPVQSLEISARDALELAPGGLHLMFYGVAQPFAEGEEIPVQFTFEHAGIIAVVLPVRRSAPQDQAGH